MIIQVIATQPAVYSLTDAGEKEFERLMFEIARKPIYIFLDLNAVIVNLDNLTPDSQKSCVEILKKM